ncbi:uncharacterized protein K460DRAFT_375833 [Cucurbitaria berberidis CBS 394.84]|uniref:Uncharacterized protein n=1 Tax=Cucurbitaria berberidis CBS 394.84 TaxID=1168544 RepID=A0A9P4GPC7_9PLEO|nr:uncharacterized protein K460DRAFT_375833 [Cucurbitaria berberidis CBS 394.84]KAF1849119.1 hypothetical protein K460DRAFT_375833 [Cucurbitaria berberidis CBS 394.84]
MYRTYSDASSGGKEKAKKPKYRVRFRHGVYPNPEGQATRADIKKYEYFFGGGQVWVGMPGKVNFVDESAQVTEDFVNGGRGGGGSSERSRSSSRLLVRPGRNERIPRATSRRSPRTTELSFCSVGVPSTDQGAVPTAMRTVSSSPWQIPSHPRYHTSPAPGSAYSHEESSPSSWRDDVPSPFSLTNLSLPTTTQAPGVAWPIENPIDAHLFRFWIDKASAWWDITSSHNIFREVVPKLALSNAMLMNAIFMISAQHIQRVNPAFPARPYMYHERILQQLIPYLAERGRIDDEATLVAAMLLRSFEEFHAGTQGQQMLSTLELFQGPNYWLFDMSKPVVQACFMVHVHFEIFHGLLNRPSMRIDYRDFPFPFLASPSDDVAWGNRIVWLCARILQWTERGLRTTETWHQLTNLVDAWERERPMSFDAFFCREENLDFARDLPELWFASPCHADAHQHLRICRMALATNSPEVEHDEVQLADVTAPTRKAVLKGLIEMMAIARCNAHAMSAPLIAAHAIHKFAVQLRWSGSESNGAEV